MTVGLNEGKIKLIKITDKVLFKVEVGTKTTYDKFPKDKEALTPIKDVYMGNFFDLMYNGDWMETFKFCYPKNPWDVFLWMEYDVNNNLCLPKNSTEGKWIGNVEIERSKEYLSSYKFLGR